MRTKARLIYRIEYRIVKKYFQIVFDKYSQLAMSEPPHLYFPFRVMYAIHGARLAVCPPVTLAPYAGGTHPLSSNCMDPSFPRDRINDRIAYAFRKLITLAAHKLY